jgi:glycopeptide antibiotics resistance protein
MPFWSYWAALKGARVLAQEIVMNIVVFIPVGFLTGWMQKRATWKTSVLTGATISITIELLQLTLKRGCYETDDVINNSIGCLMGYWLFLLTKKMV